jgi:hypothetical protein
MCGLRKEDMRSWGHRGQAARWEWMDGEPHPAAHNQGHMRIAADYMATGGKLPLSRGPQTRSDWDREGEFMNQALSLLCGYQAQMTQTSLFSPYTVPQRPQPLPGCHYDLKASELQPNPNIT